MKGRRGGNEVFQGLKRKKKTSKHPYSAKLSFKNCGKNKDFLK